MTTTPDSEILDANLIEQAAKIVSAYVSHNSISLTDLPALIVNTHVALRSLSATQDVEPAAEQRQFVSIKKSITPDFIICLDDGKKFKSMKRHLAGLGMTPDQYRVKWGLPSDYPMVASNYSEARSTIAKSVGLGRKPGTRVSVSRKTVGEPVLN